jgi:hypothetical protein
VKGAGRRRLVVRRWAPGHRAFGALVIWDTVFCATAFCATAPSAFRGSALGRSALGRLALGRLALGRLALGGPAQRASRTPASGPTLRSAAFRAFGARAFRSDGRGGPGAPGYRLLRTARDGALGTGRDDTLGTGRDDTLGTGRAVGGGALGAGHGAAGELGRYVAGRRRDVGGRRPRRPVDGQRSRLGQDPAFMTLKEIREALGLRGIDTDHHAWLAHRLLERVTHVTGQRIGRSS